MVSMMQSSRLDFSYPSLSVEPLADYSDAFAFRSSPSFQDKFDRLLFLLLPSLSNTLDRCCHKSACQDRDLRLLPLELHIGHFDM